MSNHIWLLENDLEAENKNNRCGLLCFTHSNSQTLTDYRSYPLWIVDVSAFLFLDYRMPWIFLLDCRGSIQMQVFLERMSMPYLSTTLSNSLKKLGDCRFLLLTWRLLNSFAFSIRLSICHYNTEKVNSHLYSNKCQL